MDKAIRYLSLAAKAGKIILGADDCEKAIKKGKGGLLLLASDAAPNTGSRAAALAAGRKRSLMSIRYTKAELAAAVGRASPVALALVTDSGLAAAFSAAANAMKQEERV